MFAIIFLLRGAAWETFLNPGIDVLFGQRGTARIWWMPMYVWADRLQILIPFVPALYISLWISAWFYRLVFRLGGNSEIARRRAGRLAYYGSGLTPVMMILAGILTLLCILMNDEWNWVIGGWKPVLFVAAILFSIVLPVAFYYPTLTLLIRAGKGSVRNVLAMVLLFPLAAAGACALSFIAVFWIFGYVAVAFWAMAH